MGWSDEFWLTNSNFLSSAAALQSFSFRFLLPSSPQSLFFPMTTNSRHYIYNYIYDYIYIIDVLCSSFIEIYIETYRTRNTMYFLGPVSFFPGPASLGCPGNLYSFSMIARCMVALTWLFHEQCMFCSLQEITGNCHRILC